MIIEGFLQRARRGESVFICEVRDAFAAADSFAECVVELASGEMREWRIHLPDVGSAEEESFVSEYFYANVYNLISTFGGKYMALRFDSGDKHIGRLCASLDDVFQTGAPRGERTGYGKCLNVTDRINAAMGYPPFRFEIMCESGSRLSRLAQCSAEESSVRLDNDSPLAHDADETSARFEENNHLAQCADKPHACLEENSPLAHDADEPSARLEKDSSLSNGADEPFPCVVDVLKNAVGATRHLALCGLDIGGTDIKAVGVLNGELVALKEYDWRPADMTGIDQVIDPILLIVRVIRAALTLPDYGRGNELRAVLLDKDASYDDMCAPLLAAEVEFGEFVSLDGIGVGFPDVVIQDKIVGGETLKTRGIRAASPDYEAEFGRLAGLNDMLLTQCKPGGAVHMTNDGSLAAYTAAVELALSGCAGDVADGVFAHTLGTELGSGWIDENGDIPQIPLEIYNCVIDLGNYPARAFDSIDLRSIRNFNTDLPGTMQKYASQYGAYRLALGCFKAKTPERYRELIDMGLIEEKGGGVYVKLSPEDKRKALLAHIMELADEGQPQAEFVLREIGRCLAATWRETEFLLSPKSKRRVLYGRFVKSRECLKLIREGVGAMLDITLDAGNEGLAFSPLMRSLEADTRYTVAQFGQAVGAVHFAASAVMYG